MVDATQSFAMERRDKLPVFSIFGSTFRIFGKAPLVFILLGFVTQIPIIARLLVSAPMTQKFTAAAAVVIVANLLILFLIQTAITYIAVRLVNDQPAPVGSALQLGAQRYLPMLGTTILLLLAIYGGIVLLIVPGVILSLMFAVAAPVCALETMGPVASLKRSSFLTKNMRWRILGVYILFFAPLMIVSMLIAFLVTMRGHVLAGQWISVAIQLFWVPLATIFSSMIYVELRRLKENVGVATVFD